MVAEFYYGRLSRTFLFVGRRINVLNKTFDKCKQLQACNHCYLLLPKCTFAKKACDVQGCQTYNQHFPWSRKVPRARPIAGGRPEDLPQPGRAHTLLPVSGPSRRHLCRQSPSPLAGTPILIRTRVTLRRSKPERRCPGIPLFRVQKGLLCEYLPYKKEVHIRPWSQESQGVLYQTVSERPVSYTRNANSGGFTSFMQAQWPDRYVNGRR